jgi:SulP family sulfate permease
LDRGLEWCEDQILISQGEDPQVEGITLDKQLGSMLPAEVITDHLLSYFERREVPTGSYLINQGDPPDCLYFIESGQVTAQLEKDELKPIRLETMRDGRMVGEIGFFLNKERTAAVIADKPTVVYQLSRIALQKMEAEKPDLAFALHQGIIGLLSERLTHLITTVDALLR